MNAYVTLGQYLEATAAAQQLWYASDDVSVHHYTVGYSLAVLAVVYYHAYDDPSTAAKLLAAFDLLEADGYGTMRAWPQLHVLRHELSGEATAPPEDDIIGFIQQALHQ